MAVVVPAKFPDDHPGSEKKIHRALREETPSDWMALHSVGLAVHDRKPWAEIDFVVITDRVVLCIEVKGGLITVEDGTWYTNGNRLTHSPFEQAGGGAGALKGFLRERLGDDAPIVGWAVAFPATTFTVVAPWAHPDLLYDERDLDKPFHGFIDRVADHWIGRQEGAVPHLAEERIKQLFELLAPDFCLTPTLRARVHGLDDEFVRLTEEQVEVIEGFSDQRRLLVSGGAGSGKTMLAMAEAERLAVEGRVLLCCRSAPLARELRKAMDSREGVQVESAIQLSASIVAKANLSNRLPEARDVDLLAIHVPMLATEGFGLLDYERFDALIVDEAQDLVQKHWLGFFERVLAGGLDDGLWRIFYDPNQDLLLGTDPDAVDALEGRAESRYRLPRNCRSTRQVATAATQACGLPVVDRLSIDGPDVEIEWFHNGTEERARATAIVREWITGGIPPDEITVLADNPLQETCLAGAVAEEMGAAISDQWSSREPGSEPAIAFSTVEEFKGLESEAVLILGVDDLAPGAPRFQLYVAMTRAKSLLGVLLDARVEQTFHDLVSEFNERVRTGLISVR